MNVKILFPIACLMACDPKSEPKQEKTVQEKTVWQKLGDEGKQVIFNHDFGTFIKFVERVKENIKKKSIDFTGTYDEIIGLITDTELTSGDVSTILSGTTTIDKANGKWSLAKLA